MNTFRRYYLIQRARFKDRVVSIFDRFGLKLIPLSHWQKLANQRDRLFLELADRGRHVATEPLHGIIFSKDRPLQVEGLINSYFGLVKNPAAITVLFRTSTPSFRGAYEKMKARLVNAPVRFVEETSFRQNMIELLDSLDSERIFFLVDDDIFIRSFDMADVQDVDMSKYIVSMRLGLNLSYCYTAGRAMPFPPHHPLKGSDFITWRWTDGVLDWAYPMATDGHIFSRVEILIVAKASEFFGPNSFEEALASFSSIFEERQGLAFAASRLMNVPANMVQTEVQNFAGNASASDLLRCWDEGYSVDWPRLKDFQNCGVHQDIELPLAKTLPKSS